MLGLSLGGDLRHLPCSAHYFGKPVIDETSLSGHYDIHFTWKDLDDLKQVLRQQLGLEFVPSHESIGMLVLKKAK